MRLVIELCGEKSLRVDPHIGLLHRGTEKLAEHRTYIQTLPYLDRLDYVSMMSQEHAYCLALEKAAQLAIPERAQAIRVIFSEITRILNHLMAVTTHALDVGALTPFLWAFEEREKLMEFYERVSGARMHASYFRPGGVAQDVPFGFINDLFIFANAFPSRLDELEELLTENRIWKQRLVNVGVCSRLLAKQYGFSGVMLRATGIKWDLRKTEPYEIYKFLNFQSFTGKYGDSYDRYLIRINEMRQAINLIGQTLNDLPSGPIKIINNKYTPSSRAQMKTRMENVIHHFKYFTECFTLPALSFYSPVESPKGEFGVFLSTNNTNKPLRLKFRSPGYFHLQALTKLGLDVFLSDMVTLVGTIDVVFGEIDR